MLNMVKDMFDDVPEGTIFHDRNMPEGYSFKGNFKTSEDNTEKIEFFKEFFSDVIVDDFALDILGMHLKNTFAVYVPVHETLRTTAPEGFKPAKLSKGLQRLK